MELDWSCPKNAEQQNFYHRTDMASRRKKESRPTKTIWRRTGAEEQERLQLGWISWASARLAAKLRQGQVETVYTGRMCQWARRD